MKLVIIFLAFCLLSSPLYGKKLYQYKDKQGHWHFSDKPPNTSQKIEVKQLKVAHQQYIWLKRTGKKNKPEYFVVNNYAGPVEVEVLFIKISNAYSNPELPKRFIIQPGQSDALFKIAGIDVFKQWSYSLQYRYAIGSPLAVHDNYAVYQPPFPSNLTFPVSQAFGGEFSHTNKQNQYAVDIAMPVDTPIHAARSGKVIEVNSDFYNRGTKKAYKTRANSVRILHDDGSMAIYAHLALERATVYPGLKVSSGQLIGFSGNTGFTTGPHLHFAVQVNKGMELVSVPFKFTGVGGVAREPVKNMDLNSAI